MFILGFIMFLNFVSCWVWICAVLNTGMYAKIMAAMIIASAVIIRGNLANAGKVIFDEV